MKVTFIKYFCISLVVVLFANCATETKLDNPLEVSSPDGAINFEVSLDSLGTLHYTLKANDSTIIQKSRLGILRSDANLADALTFVGSTPIDSVNSEISFITGKEVTAKNHYVTRTFSFQNADSIQIDYEVRAFNDGVALRASFPKGTEETVQIIDDVMEFDLSKGSTAWLQPYNPKKSNGTSYEAHYGNVELGSDLTYDFGWSFPGLFQIGNQWVLLSESDVESGYSGSHLFNEKGSKVFSLRWAEEGEMVGGGNAQPIQKLPSHTTWKTIMVGGLDAIVASNMVRLVAPENKVSNTEWIKPGRASWSWLSDHPSPKDFDKLKKFIDLAHNMTWEYSLVDANWDLMKGGTVEELNDYAKSKDVGLLLWYNSGGPHNTITERPRDTIYSDEARKREFARIQQLGFKGIKVDFFLTDKQPMISHYKEILEDAAEHELLVNFHGCTLPRGWSRAYPNLMTMESVPGAEAYTYADGYSEAAPMLNTILPYTRNVIGSMDYTPVIFTDMEYPHITTYAHELALAVIFESGWTHFADAVEGYYDLPVKAKEFLMQIPVVWDEVRYLQGTPGEDVVLARRKGTDWYIGGISSLDTPKSYSLDLSFLESKYHIQQFFDGETDDQFAVGESTGVKNLTIPVLPYGGFVLKASLK